MNANSFFKFVHWVWDLLRFVLLAVLYFVFFAIGGNIVSPALPTDVVAEPGPLPLMPALLVLSAVSALTIILMIYSSRWYGWKLMVAMALSYYGAVTFLTQIETWYFLEGLTVDPQILPLLFLQGMPVAFLFVPLAVIILGRARKPAVSGEPPKALPMPWKEWAWKLAAVAVAYVLLYYGAGYFIAYQNPDLRAFYGETGEMRTFFGQIIHILTTAPWLTPFQIMRSFLWLACAWPILRGSRWPLWATALVVAIMFSAPQNIGHILPNVFIPDYGVRLSHLIETASSTFVFGLIVSWLFYPKYAEAKVTQRPAASMQQQPA